MFLVPVFRKESGRWVDHKQPVVRADSKAAAKAKAREAYPPPRFKVGEPRGV